MLTLKKILAQPEAKETFDRLVEEKLTQKLLEYWLCSIACLSDKARAKRFDRRRAASLVKKARKLATEIDRDFQFPAIPFIGLGTDLEEILTLPRILRTYASCIDKSLSMHGSGSISPRSEEIAALLEIIKEETGRYHYEEVTVLLNAVDAASGRGEDGPFWDVTNLKQRQYLARKRLARTLSK